MVKHFVIFSTLDVLYGCLQQKTNVCQRVFSLTSLSAPSPVSKPFMSPSEQAQPTARSFAFCPSCAAMICNSWFLVVNCGIHTAVKTAREDPTMAPSTSHSKTAQHPNIQPWYQAPTLQQPAREDPTMAPSRAKRDSEGAIQL